MERKTLEEILEENCQNSPAWTDDRTRGFVIHTMLEYADQEKEVGSCEFAEWLSRKTYMPTGDGKFFNLTTSKKSTPSELYQIFKQQTGK